MHSSTSSSSSRLPEGPWIRSGILATVLAVAAIGGWELTLRSYGYKPALNDDDALWSNARSTVRPSARDAFVLLGASRMQCGVNLAAFEEVTGHRPVQLAVDGSSSLPVLEHLAKSKSFCGTVVIDIWPWSFCKADPSQGVAAERVRVFEKRTFSGLLESRLCLEAQSALTFRLPDWSPSFWWTYWQKGKMPKLPYMRLLLSRERLADYTLVETLDVPMYLPPLGKPPGDPESRTPEQWRQIVDRIQQSIAAIQSRGGQVLLFYFPSSGTTRRWEEDSWPRWKYWDVLAANTTAIAVHPDDYISLRGWHCPDASHLDYREAPAFTRAMATVFKSRLAGQQPSDYDPPENVARRVNHALTATVAASTAFIPEYAVEHLVREPETGDWSALAAEPNPNTITLDLGEVRQLKRADLLLLVYEGHIGWITDHAWHASVDARSWWPIFDARSPVVSSLPHRHPSALGYDLTSSPPLRYLRLTVRQAVGDDRALLRRLLLWSEYVEVDRLPPLPVEAVQPAPDLTDLAKGAVLLRGPAFEPEHDLFWALRGRRDARFAQLPPGPQTFEIDLGWTVDAAAVEFYTPATGATFDASVSVDGAAWTPTTAASAASEPAAPAEVVRALSIPAGQKVRYVRVAVGASDSPVRIHQIKLTRR